MEDLTTNVFDEIWRFYFIFAAQKVPIFYWKFLAKVIRSKTHFVGDTKVDEIIFGSSNGWKKKIWKPENGKYKIYETGFGR